MQPIEHTVSSQHQHGIHMMSPTTHRCPLNAGTMSCVHGENRRYSKERFVETFHIDSKNSTVSDSILLFVGKPYLDDPYNKMFTRLSSK